MNPDDVQGGVINTQLIARDIQPGREEYHECIKINRKYINETVEGVGVFTKRIFR